jgi:chorismate--pyruvate lyase
MMARTEPARSGPRSTDNHPAGKAGDVSSGRKVEDMDDRRCSYDPAPMLTRLSTRSRAVPRAGSHAALGCRLPVSRSLRRWLEAPGSLTARLRRHGPVTVEVLRQGRFTLWPQERAALRARQGHVREVVLRVRGRAAVWARSSTPLRAVKGPWRAIKGLGTRPLAELLFEHHRVRRDPLHAWPLAQRSPQQCHLVRQWHALQPAADDAPPLWARHSVFWHHGQPLQVLESFSPWVGRLSAGPHRG